MAKWRKTISLDEYNETLKPGGELSWGDTVPFEAVRTPEGTEWVAWHCDNFPIHSARDARGTMYIQRNDCGHWNFYVYDIRGYDSETITIDSLGEEITEIPHATVKRIEEIPERFRNSMPEHYRVRLEYLVNQDS
ncbi:hypothetical protein HY416_01785 [Candidatus Kaiserbacteria bacterium]|nr:hypothetical protein [Candidatus Kaiserbacteria bacterium]